MGYLFGGYFILWAATFGYLYVLGTRQRRLEQELASLREAQGERLRQDSVNKGE